MAATDTFNEKETGYVTLTFTDEDDVAVVPDSATYTLYDEVTGGVINSRNQTAISSLASTLDLELTSLDNVIVTSGTVQEAHILFVEWVYNTDKLGKQEYRFFVCNLTKVT